MIQTVGDLKKYLEMFYDNQPLIVINSKNTEFDILTVNPSDDDECVIVLDD